MADRAMRLAGTGIWSGELRYGEGDESHAGAVHVCIQVCTASERTDLPRAERRALAQVLERRT